MQFAYHSIYQKVLQIFDRQQNRLYKQDLVVDSIDMVRMLFVNHPSLVSYNSIHVIYFENYLHTVFHLNFHQTMTIYYDCPDRIVSIYHQMEFQFYYSMAHTIPIDGWIFQSNKLVRFWVFAVLFQCYNYFASL